MVVALPALTIREAERQPDLRVVVHEIRATRHDSDDLKPSSIDVEAVADDRPRAEDGLPQLIRDHRHGRRADEAGFLAGEKTPLSRLHVKRVQQVRVDDGRADAERPITSHKICLAGAERADIG